MNYTKDKSKDEILESMVGTTRSTESPVWKQMELGIIVRCTEDIEKSIKNLENQIRENSESSDELGKKLLWLNIVLTVATVIGAIATALMAYKAF